MKNSGIHDECGVFGIVTENASNIANDIYFGLFALQHRGQESAGIAVACGKNKVIHYKNMGLVNDVFNSEELARFPMSNAGVGHVRYSPSCTNNIANAQPVVFYGRQGRMAIAQNGSIMNVMQLKSQLIRQGHIFQSSIDSEVIAALINIYGAESTLEGVVKTCKKLVGSFGFVLFANRQLFAARDPYGLKPLVIGKRGSSYIFASESCALEAVDATFVRDVEPGEIVCIGTDGNLSSIFFSKPKKSPCIFEYVYIARSDSVIDGVSVYDARYECGKKLAKLYKIEADIVAGVPDSALVAARGYSDASGILYVDALSKNRYSGRTFIQPNQAMRENSVKMKLSAIRGNIKGKRLILIDDSIVRGTTCKKIVNLLRQGGAAEVHVIIASPMVKHACYYGVDMQTPDQLIANKKSKDEICAEIGADSLNYLPLEKLVNACGGKCGARGCTLCTGCFSGSYPIAPNKNNFGDFELE